MPLAAQVAQLSGLTHEDVLAGKTSIASLAALVADAALVVCGDTGIGHLATAYGTPSVLLFGPSSAAEWGPPPSRSMHVVLRHPTAGGVDPRGDQVDPGLLALTVDDVLATASLPRCCAPALASRRSSITRDCASRWAQAVEALSRALGFYRRAVRRGAAGVAHCEDPVGHSGSRDDEDLMRRDEAHPRDDQRRWRTPGRRHQTHTDACEMERVLACQR